MRLLRDRSRARDSGVLEAGGMALEAPQPISIGLVQFLFVIAKQPLTPHHLPLIKTLRHPQPLLRRVAGSSGRSRRGCFGLHG